MQLGQWLPTPRNHQPTTIRTEKDTPTTTAPLEPGTAPTSQAGSRCPAIQTSTDGSATARHNSTLSPGNLTCTRVTCIRVCRMQYTYLPPNSPKPWGSE